MMLIKVNIFWNEGYYPVELFKTDSAKSSSNKCKNYLLKIYLQYIDFLNTIWNFSL